MGPVHGRVLSVPDVHAKGEIDQRDVLFVRTSLSQIELREVEGGVLIYYHRQPIIVSCESPSLPDLSRDSARCESPVLESSSPILASSSAKKLHQLWSIHHQILSVHRFQQKVLLQKVSTSHGQRLPSKEKVSVVHVCRETP